MIDRKRLHELRLEASAAESIAELSAVVSQLIELLEKSEAVDTVPLLSCTCGVDEHNELCPTHGQTDRPSPTEGVAAAAADAGEPAATLIFRIRKTLQSGAWGVESAAALRDLEELERRYSVFLGGVKTMTNGELLIARKFLTLVFAPHELDAIVAMLRKC